MTLIKKIVVGIIAVTFAIMILRETSSFDLNFYQSYSNSSFSSTINTNSSFVSWGDMPKKPASEFNSQDLSIVLLHGQDTIYKELNKLMPIIVEIKYSQTGSLWVPLYKSVNFSAVGIPSFDARQKLKGEFQKEAYKIGMSGQLKMDGQIVIKGICSHKEALKLVRAQIIEKFSSSIKEEFAKQSPEYFQAMSHRQPSVKN